MKLLKKLLALLAVFAIPVLAMAVEKKEVSPEKVERIKQTYNGQLSRNGFKPGDLQVYSIGKSHIDAAWKWRLKQTRDEKCPATFKNAITHSFEYPGFNYTQSSGQYYEWVEEVDPKLFADIQKAEKEGRWFITGGMWVEPDGNMPEGESFVRQFLYGQRYFLEKFGHITDVCWMEDSFGYNWNLPQFSAKSGIKYMYTAKPTWNGHNIFPFHLFQWQGPDGSRVLTHVSPTVLNNNLIPLSEIENYYRDDYFISGLDVVNGRSYLARYKQTRLLLQPGAKLTANYLTTPAQVKAALSKEMMPVIGVFYGEGDGGHGPLVNEIENQMAMQQLGYARISNTDELFQAFEKYSDRLPAWDDEIYFEYHQAVMTTHEWIKRMNRGSEALMRTAEAAASTAFLYGAEYPAAKLKKTWKVILLHQFHDILPGSSIAEVYQDAALAYQQVDKDGSQVIDSSLAALSEKIDTSAASQGREPLLVYNPLGWERSDAVKYQVPANSKYRVFDANGQELVSQAAATEEGGYALYFNPGAVPGLGWKIFYLKSGETCSLKGPEVKDSADKIEIENDLVRIAIDKKSGLLVSLYDKGLKKEFLKRPSNKILAFNDPNPMDPAWNLAENYLKKPIPVPEPGAVKVDLQGPLFVRVLVERPGKPTSFKQWITLCAGSPLVNIVTRTDNPWRDSHIKVEFNTVVETDKIAAEIPYAVIERSNHSRIPWDAARTELPIEKWVDLSDANSGIALLNFGKHGVSRNEDAAGFRMSIVHNAMYPTAAAEAYDVKKITKYIPDRETDAGENWAHLALFPHRGSWKEGTVSRAAYEYNTPVAIARAGVHKGALPAQAGMFRLESKGAYIASVKKAEDDDCLVIRLVEGSGKDTSATLKVNPSFKIAAAWETDLLELNPKPLTPDDKSLTVPVGHFELKTIKLKLGAR